MARKLFCKLSHERGEKFSVSGVIYTIGADGFVEVSDDHAPTLLQNAAKWADASIAPAPFKRPTAPPQLILADATGRVLSEEETAKAVQEARSAAPEPEAEAPKVEELPPEPAPPEWPTLTTDSSKTEMLTTLDRLKAAGHVQASDYAPKMGKRDLLEVIERAYDSMA